MRVRSLRTLLLTLLVLQLSPAPQSAAADQPLPELPPHHPVICLGITALTNGRKHCPESHVLIEVSPGGVRRTAEPHEIQVHGSCCRLPADDILTGEHLEVDSECPEGWVVTGGDFPYEPCDLCTRKMRCSRVNPERYELGPGVEAAYWGFGSQRWKHFDRYTRLDMPPAIRFAVGRRSAYTWHPQGCIGLPFGSLLVKKSTKRCPGFVFRELRYRGLPGDPPAGTPVQMFPECDFITDRFNPEAECRRWER